MPRILLIGLAAGVMLIASALLSPAIEMAAGATVSIAAQAAENPNASRTKTKRPDHFIKRGQTKAGGPPGSGPAALAVSDPGADGPKPVKKSNK